MQGSHSWQLLSILSGLPLLLSILSGLLETARGPGLYVILSQKQSEIGYEIDNARRSEFSACIFYIEF